MALETLEYLTKVGGYDLVNMDKLRLKHPDKFNETGAMDALWFETEIRPHNFVYVRHDKNSLSFTLQNGPIGEVGVNGCQVDTLIHAACHIVTGLNRKFPCAENKEAMAHLRGAIIALDKRKQRRSKEGVEGTNAETPGA